MLPLVQELKWSRRTREISDACFVRSLSKALKVQTPEVTYVASEYMCITGG